MRSKRIVGALLATVTMGLSGPVWGQTAIELKKDLFRKYKQAQAEGKDLGEAGKEYQAGDAALQKGMDEEAVEHFKKAKELWPGDAG
jgi:hypothetical protein